MSDSPVNPFDAFWQNPAHARWFSAGDVGTLASTILTTCGAGPLLDVGCGSGRLLEALRTLGLTVRGIDSSAPAIDLCNRSARGSALKADGLHLPFEPQSFDTVVCAGLADLLDDEQCALLLAQLRRVARRSVVVVSGQNLPGNPSPRSRAKLQSIAFDAGLRRHPCELRAIPYAALESDPPPRIMLFEPIADEPWAAFPLSWLEAHRDLHSDHSRSSGRRADAHLARYAFACEYVREGDRVLDIACGMGYGSRTLSMASSAATVHGIDSDPRAIDYAKANFTGPRTTFEQDDAHTLPSVADSSADVIVSFETLEHLPQPQAFLSRAAQILRPGGRLIVSVPNQWADESGKDPNPHHHHVYSLDTLREQIGQHFIIEQTFRQTAGGGWKLSEQPRRLEPLVFDAPAEWLLMVAMKTPIGAPADFKETLFPPQPADPAYNLYQFNRDYDNPALFRSMICMGPRLTDDAQLGTLALQVLQSCRVGSADHGAAVCVLAYQSLAAPVDELVRTRLSQINAFAAAADGSAHARRWVISLEYAAAKLHLCIGERERALARFEACAAMDASIFSPVLGTKTVDAACWAGMLHALDGQLDQARHWWIRGIQEARRLTQLPWLNVIGEEHAPQPYGLLELSHVIDAASHCAGWLAAADRLGDQPAMAGILARRQTAGDTRQYIKDLLASKRWLQAQVASGAANEDLIAQVQRLRESMATLESSRAWLSEQVRNFKAAAIKAASDYEQAQNWGKAADQGRQWLQNQLQESKAREAVLQKSADELRAHAAELQRAKSWLDGQCQSLSAIAKERDGIIGELRTYIAQLEEGKAWHAAQAERYRALLESKEGQIDSLTARTAELEKSRADLEQHGAQLREQGLRLEQQLDQARQSALEASATMKAQAAAISDLEASLANQSRAAAESLRIAHERAAALEDSVRRLMRRSFLERVLNRDPEG